MNSTEQKAHRTVTNYNQRVGDLWMPASIANLQDVSKSVDTQRDEVRAHRDLGFWGRLRWLLRGTT